MADHIIIILLEEQHKDTADIPRLASLLSAIGQEDEEHTVSVIREELDADPVDQLTGFAQEHYCVWSEVMSHAIKNAESEGPGDAWICVPQRLMPDDIHELGAGIILVPANLPGKAKRPRCSPEPEEGPGIYIEPGNSNSIIEAIKKGDFNGIVPGTALKTVISILGNCEIDPEASCPGILGCWT